MTNVPVEQLAVEIRVPPDMADGLEQDLVDAGATDVEIEPPKPGLLPVLIVAAAVLGATGISELVLRWRDKTRFQQIIDARQDKLKMSVNREVRDGRIIVLTRDGEKVEIVEAPASMDLTKVIQAAMSGGTGSVAKIVTEAGGKIA